MSEAKILVTGATGATGRETVRLLLEGGHAVRAFVREENDRSNSLRQSGAEIVRGDLRDFESVRGALEGIRSAYFVFPIKPGILQSTAYFAQAAKEAGVEAIVNMSQASARRVARSHAAQDHWIAESLRLVRRAGNSSSADPFCGVGSLRAGFIKAGFLPLPFGSGRHAPIAAEDQARVIANILTAPEAHRGQIYPLLGAKEISFPEMAEELGRVLGKAVRYQYTDVPSLAKMSKEQGRDLGDFFWQHLSQIALDHQNGVFAGTNDLIEKIGGRPPITLTEFITKHRDALTA